MRLSFFVCVCATTNYDDSVAFGVIGFYWISLNRMFKLYYVRTRIEQMEENFSEIEFLEGKFEQIDESNEKIGSSYKDDNGKDTEENLLNLLSSNDIAEQTDRSNKKINSYELRVRGR